MKIITNDKLIARNEKISKFTTFGGMGLMIISLVLSFQNEEWYTYVIGLMLVGFILAQVGAYMGPRWWRPPRPHEAINQELKGLDDRYTLYHYSSPVNHLLVGPAGVWILSSYYQLGNISFDQERKRWKQSGGNWYMRLMGQDSIGRPELETRNNEETLQRFLMKKMPPEEIPAIETALVFTNPSTTVQAQDAPIPTLISTKLKDFIRQRAKPQKLTDEAIRRIQKLIEE